MSSAPVVELLARLMRDEDLPAAAGLADARGAMDVEPEVGVVAQRRLPGVHADADAQVDAVRPVVAGESLLQGHDRLRGPACVAEGEEELVAAMVDDVALRRVDRVEQQADGGR